MVPKNTIELLGAAVFGNWLKYICIKLTANAMLDIAAKKRAPIFD
jgi:hypothetical protein